jgi:sugar/nucleoside kinase (ribokinase family)
LGRFKDFFKVILSLNQHEADLIARAMGLLNSKQDEEFVEKLFGLVKVDILVIHRTNDALSYNGESYEKCDTFFCDEPKILTGGGDNFNAGFCYSLLNDLNPFQSLLVANAVSGSYVKSGISPNLIDLIAFLKLKKRNE